MASYTWQEVAKHNSRQSAWVSVEGKVYDVTQWVDSHPGGSEYIELAAGRDITYLFDSYHPFTDKPSAVLKKFEIGTLKTHEFPTYDKDTGFYRECKEAVGKYFKDNNLHYKSPFSGLWRMACILFVMYHAYNTIYFSEANFIVRLALASLFGVCQALLLIHMMHDACHSAIGYNEVWWKIIGRTCMDFLTGGDMKHWHHQHVIGHHVYTNVMGADPDLPELVEGDMRYIVPRQVWRGLYKHQWIYMPALYGLLAFKVRIQNWTTTYSTLMNGPIRVNPISSNQYAYFFFSRCCNIAYQLILPMIFGSLNPAQVFLYWVIQEFSLGAWLAFNFQVSHISTAATFPSDKEANPEIAGEWAVLQVLSSVDYAHKSLLCTFFVGCP